MIRTGLFAFVLCVAVLPARAADIVWAILEASQYAEYDENGEPFGAGYDIIVNLRRVADIDVEIQIVPGARVLSGLMSGKYSFVTTTASSVADEAGVRLVDLVRVPIVAVATNGFDLEKPVDLMSLEYIGLYRGAAPDNTVIDQIGERAIYMHSVRNALEMMMLGRLDGFIGSSLGILRTADQMGIRDQLGQHLVLGEVVPAIYAARGMHNTPMAQKMQARIQDVVDDGGIEAVLAHQYGANWRQLGRPSNQDAPVLTE